MCFQHYFFCTNNPLNATFSNLASTLHWTPQDGCNLCLVRPHDCQHKHSPPSMASYLLSLNERASSKNEFYRLNDPVVLRTHWNQTPGERRRQSGVELGVMLLCVYLCAAHLRCFKKRAQRVLCAHHPFTKFQWINIWFGLAESTTSTVQQRAPYVLRNKGYLNKTKWKEKKM